MLLALAIAATNTFTVSFNAFASKRLETLQRGRFLANLMTLENFANAVGVFAYSGDVATFTTSALGDTAALRVFLVSFSGESKAKF